MANNILEQYAQKNQFEPEGVEVNMEVIDDLLEALGKARAISQTAIFNADFQEYETSTKESYMSVLDDYIETAWNAASKMFLKTF